MSLLTVLRRLVQPTNFLIKHNKSHKIIWQFCTPKSASTYLTIVINNVLKSQPSDELTNLIDPSINYFAEKEQVPNVRGVFFSHFFSFKKFTFHGQTHTQYTDYLDSAILSPNHRIICQTRSLLDTIASLYDHIEKINLRKKQPDTSVLPMFKTRLGEWQSLSEEERYNLIIHYYAPWHIDFLFSWFINNNKFELLLVRYEDLTTDTAKELKRILEFCSVPYREEMIKTTIDQLASVGNDKIRKNKGLRNRGRKVLTVDQQKSVQDLINIRAKYFHKISGLDLNSFL